MKGIERQLVYLFVVVVVSVPLLLELSMEPARMVSAEKLYNIVEGIEPQPGKIALVALDFGPNTKAENEPQASVIIEHLFRRGIPFALSTLYAPGEGFLTSIPEKVKASLQEEDPTRTYQYGVDWVNLGYRPGSSLFIQSLAKSNDIVKELDKDVLGSPLEDLPIFEGVKTIKDISLLTEFTGLVGVFDNYVQFFQKEDFIPIFGHGCTSITIPEAYIYLDSGQLNGLLEGIAGAAWYSKLLKDEYVDRPVDAALITNTALSVAHLIIIFFIIVGNIREYWGWFNKKEST